jgi:hypothetical protein
MCALEGLLCASGGSCAPARGSCGGGVGDCMGASKVGSPCLDAFNSCAAPLRASSGGQVVRLAMLSCAIGNTSDGVGMACRWGQGDHGEEKGR